MDNIELPDICRENWLASFVSKVRAEAAGIWHCTTPHDAQVLRLDPKRCAAYFDLRERWLTAVQPLYHEREVLVVKYEEILRWFEELTDRSTAFLGVAPR